MCIKDSGHPGPIHGRTLLNTIKALRDDLDMVKERLEGVEKVILEMKKDVPPHTHN